jgi:hypothetical protein
VSQEHPVVQQDGNLPFSNPDRKIGCYSLLSLAGATLCVGALTLPWLLIRPARPMGGMTNCKSNLKNLGTAMEMYTTDWEGRYPSTLGQLTPNYLKTIPECQAVERMTYKFQTGPNAAFKKTLERAGLPYGKGGFTPYSLRHSCATLLLLEGENPKIVSERLGHASIAETLDTYSHVLPTMQRGASDKLARVLFRSV